MTAADDAHAELMHALTVERFTHLPENVPAERAGRGQGSPHSANRSTCTATGPRRGAQRLTQATNEARHKEAS
jgi:hypothetical protein